MFSILRDKDRHSSVSNLASDDTIPERFMITETNLLRIQAQKSICDMLLCVGDIRLDYRLTLLLTKFHQSLNENGTCSLLTTQSSRRWTTIIGSRNETEQLIDTLVGSFEECFDMKKGPCSPLNVEADSHGG